jgi:hypothetical protein
MQGIIQRFLCRIYIFNMEFEIFQIENELVYVAGGLKWNLFPLGKQD